MFRDSQRIMAENMTLTFRKGAAGLGNASADPPTNIGELDGALNHAARGVAVE